MKKVLLMSLAMFLGVNAYAQEEDVTHLIKNAGFDEGLTFTDETGVQMSKRPCAVGLPIFQPQWLYTHDTKPEQSNDVLGELPPKTYG